MVDKTDFPGDGIRASNQDRERVLAILQDAHSQGRINIDEFTDRSNEAMAAKTVGDLRPLVNDLPVDFNSGASVPVVDGPEAVEWKGAFGSLKRTGAWTVPRRIILRRRMGSVELDFTQAQFTGPLVDIELDLIGGSIEIRVPEAADVSTDDIDVVLGSVEDHRRHTTSGGQPKIRFTGILRWGSLEVRGPKRRLFG